MVFKLFYDKQTDRRAPGENNMSPNPEGGRHTNQLKYKELLYVT